ncbi:MAG TPA: MFS transporter [Rhizomicrobium sp.]|nr:MFS transporter [Rhizomicrobium sp.]
MSDAKAVQRHPFRAYLRPRTLTMLALGFSSGLPFLLVGNTFGYWLRDAGTTLTAIGFISWVGIAYSVKYLWAPLVDRTDVPGLGWLGRRRSWMAFAQILIALGLFGMAATGPASLAQIGAFALVVAFASATQDTVIDAWRIESAESGEELGLLSSAYQFGYRIALLATDAWILAIAQRLGWPISYSLYGGLMAVGLIATFVAVEPVSSERADETAERLSWWRRLVDAVIGPFIVFFNHYGALALLMLVAIALYRLPDFVMGPMANPYYHDIGLTKDMVAGVRTSVGLVAALAGIAAGGFFALRFGYMRALILGGVLQALAIAAFAILAFTGGDLLWFSAVMFGDNFGTSFAGVALVSYMSSLTTRGYTATQYALLASSYALIGKVLKGFSGAVVESLSTQMGLMHAYAIFFVGAGLIGLPAIVLFWILDGRQRAAIAKI